MNVSIGNHWEQFVEGLVKSGRYGSASEVMREGLRLIEMRDIEFRALKGEIEASIARGGSNSADDVRAHLRKVAGELENHKTAAE